MIILYSVIAVIILITINYLVNPTHIRFNKAVARTNSFVVENHIITEDDLAHLPQPLKKYLNYVGVVGKNRVNIADFRMHGKMKLNQDTGWESVKVEQTSNFSHISRLFYITMNFKGLGIRGIHLYENTNAKMIIKILDLIKVADAKGELMNIGETVTVFNDFCLLAPMALIDERMTWETIDDLNVKGTFTNENISVSAILTFADDGRLVNFYSEDRYYSTTGSSFEKIPWSTPVSEYHVINGLNLPRTAKAIWHLETGDFPYAEFTIEDYQFR